MGFTGLCTPYKSIRFQNFESSLSRNREKICYTSHAAGHDNENPTPGPRTSASLIQITILIFIGGNDAKRSPFIYIAPLSAW